MKAVPHETGSGSGTLDLPSQHASSWSNRISVLYPLAYPPANGQGFFTSSNEKPRVDDESILVRIGSFGS